MKLFIDKKNIFLKLFKRLILLLIIVFILDFIIGSVLDKYYFRQKSGQGHQLTNAIENISADIMIFGSSTAKHDYSPEELEKSLHKSCYNMGLAGSSMFYHYAILSAVLKRYTPQILILNFDMQEFKKETIFYDRLSILLPYYKNHPEIRSAVDLKSPYERFKLLSKIYPYNSLIYKIITGNTEAEEKEDEENNGYNPLFQTWDEKLQDCSSLFLQYELDTNKIKFYEAFIKKCVERKIQLYIFCSPIFCNYNTSKSIVVGQQIADKYNIPFFDCSKDSIFLNNQHFFGNTVEHLNDDGAKVFTDEVIKNISTKN